MIIFSLDSNLSEKDLIIKLDDIINNPSDQYKEFYIDVLKEGSYLEGELSKINSFNHNIYLDGFHGDLAKQIYTFFPDFIERLAEQYGSCSNPKAQAYYDNLFKKLLLIQ